MRIDPARQVVHVDGVRVNLDESRVYLAFNKPLGVVSTMNDDLGRISLADYVGDRNERLFHVGRLDADTEGLLLLTNDGDLANRLQHPSHGVAKTYIARIAGPVPRDLGRRLRDGVELDDGPAKVDSFKVVDSQPGKAMVEVVIHEGRKHIVRRMLDAVGHPVETLVRVQVGPDPARRPQVRPDPPPHAGRGRPALRSRPGCDARERPRPGRRDRAHRDEPGDRLVPRRVPGHPDRPLADGGAAGPRPRSRRDRRTRSTDAPDLVVVAAPPDVAARWSLESLAAWPDAVVTDVASVKGSVAEAVRDGGGDLTRYVGSHPMAGRERSGAGAARADLFDGRAWVVVPTEKSRPDAVDLVRQVAVAVGVGGDRHGRRGARRGRGRRVARTPARRQPRRRPAPRRLRPRGRPGRAGAARRHPDRGQRPAAVDADPRRATPRPSATS